MDGSADFSFVMLCYVATLGNEVSTVALGIELWYVLGAPHHPPPTRIMNHHPHRGPIDFWCTPKPHDLLKEALARLSLAGADWNDGRVRA